MNGWDRLGLRGERVEATRTSDVPRSVAELLAKHGLGSLLGLFTVLDPGSPAWVEAQASILDLRTRGHFAGIDAATFASLVVFARERHGHALAVSGDSTFFLLGCAGCVLPLGSSVDELLDRLPTHARVVFPTFEEVWDGKEWVPKYDWGLELSYVSRSFEGPELYLRALARGEDADALLPGALEGEPLVLALHRLVAALCGPSGDALADEARADALAPLIAKIRRRYPSLAGVPPELFAREPWRSEAVRAWASGEPLPMRPFAAEPRAPIVEPITALAPLASIPDEARAPLEAPRLDDEAILASWLVAWDALAPAAPLSHVRRLIDETSPSLRFAVVRRLAWNLWHGEAHRYPVPDAYRELVGRAFAHRAVEGTGRLSWPLVLVATVHAGGGPDPSLWGVEDLALTDALVALAEQGHDWCVRGYVLANGATLPDASLDRLLPSLKKKGVDELVVRLVMGRMDDDRVYELALVSLKKWPRLVAPQLVSRPGDRTLSALRAQLSLKKLLDREAVARALVDLGDREAGPILEETTRRIDESI